MNEVSPTGLTEEEAASRLARFGLNELPSARKKTAWSLLIQVVMEPMVGLLLACGLVYLILGEAHDAIPLLMSVLFVIGIGFYEQEKSERALEALRDLSSPRALVVRGGKERRIPGREVVPGDVLVVREGDRVAADGQLLEVTNLRIDESLLTGESVPVDKGAQGRVFSGSLVVAGKGLFEATETGLATEMGKIGESIGSVAPERSRLQIEVSSIVARFGALGVATSVSVTVLYGMTRNDWPRGVLAGLATAMSLLPEEFPLVLTLFLALGAWRISRVKVLTREPRAIESLGRIDTLCVDKTGTLTWNRMTVSELRATGKGWRTTSGESGPMPEEFHELVEYGALASHVDAFDPMDRAIRGLLETELRNTEHIHRDWELVREYPLSPELMAMSCVWKSRQRGNFAIASKGAPEAVIDLCHLDGAKAGEVARQVEEMSKSGLRVLAVAKATFPKEALPGHPHQFDFEFIGLLGLEDPIREEVPAALAECKKAGIRVIMMTGDHIETAKAIARKAGFPEPVQAMTGGAVERLSDLELTAALRTTSVFARMVPQQKLRLIHALKSGGHIVAMTGDGVNDAPALKWADIGISMGERGTDVAREASDLVLVDDRFSSIVAAIRMGRRVYENIGKAMSFIFAVHAPIAGLAILPVVFGAPLILMPAHIVFLELIIDPASTLAYEAEEGEGDLMSRPPRGKDEAVFGWHRILRASMQGLVVLAVTATLMWISIRQGLPTREMRSLVFTTLILSNLSLMLANRDSRHPLGSLRRKGSRIDWIILMASFALLVGVQHVPYLRGLLQISPLGLTQWGLSVGLASACLFVCSKLQTRSRASEA
jgi:P-type Ca2+ transporter type 2C